MYKYVRIGSEVQNIAIPIDSQIDRQIKLKIREKYSPSGEDDGKPNELEVHSRGMIDPNDEKFQEYLAYRQGCIDWGKTQKEQAADDMDIWADYQWDESVETRAEFITRLEKAGLL